MTGPLPSTSPASSRTLCLPAPSGLVRASLFRRRVWQPATVAAGFGELTKDEETGRTHYEGLRLHDLRHTAVALWIAAGASATEVAALPGTRRS